MRRGIYNRYKKFWEAAVSVAQQVAMKGGASGASGRDHARDPSRDGDELEGGDSSGSFTRSFKTPLHTDDEMSAKSRTPPYLTANSLSDDEPEEH
mmetsp:Transcript_68131/g.160266  ORF Transcript_68131/g.160266 Transcript_68131/m.160266 type:complete len:95 (-) Transcript_68131:280-564(-)